MASINLRADSQPRLGGACFFETVAPSKIQNPRVEVKAFDEYGNLIYAETGSLAQASGFDPVTGLTGFTLGGNPDGGSIWAQRGGAARCVASLFYFGKEKGAQTFNVLASIEFPASGS